MTKSRWRDKAEKDKETRWDKIREDKTFPKRKSKVKKK
jgi:hypothetical protein